MPRSLPLISMLEIISLVGKEQLGLSPVSVQQLVLETLTPTSEFVFNAQFSLCWGRAP